MTAHASSPRGGATSPTPASSGSPSPRGSGAPPASPARSSSEPTDPPPLGFSAAFPEKPKHEIAEKTMRYEGGLDAHLQIHRFSVEGESGIFVVTYFDVPKELFLTAASYAKTPEEKEATRARVTSAFVDDTMRGVAGSLGGRVDDIARTKRDDDLDVAFGGPLLGPDKQTRVGVFEARALLHHDTASDRHVMYTVLAATADDEDDHNRARIFVRTFALKPLATAPGAPKGGK